MKDCAPCVDSSVLTFAASPSHAAFQSCCPVIAFRRQGLAIWQAMNTQGKLLSRSRCLSRALSLCLSTHLKRFFFFGGFFPFLVRGFLGTSGRSCRIFARGSEPDPECRLGGRKFLNFITNNNHRSCRRGQIFELRKSSISRRKDYRVAQPQGCIIRTGLFQSSLNFFFHSVLRRNDMFVQGSVCLSLACNDGGPHRRIDCVGIRAAAGPLLADEDFFGRGESIEGTMASSLSALFHDHT
jgi:hypothetical protein